MKPAYKEKTPCLRPVSVIASKNPNMRRKEAAETQLFSFFFVFFFYFLFPLPTKSIKRYILFLLVHFSFLAALGSFHAKGSQGCPSYLGTRQPGLQHLSFRKTAQGRQQDGL